MVGVLTRVTSVGDRVDRPRRLYCDGIAQVTWRRLEELMCGGNNFIFNMFLYLESVQRFENMVRIACIEGDLLRKTTVHQIAVGL